MALDYLIFDPTDEEGGACSFDAMACVLPQRLPELLEEVQTVLAWAHREFGEPAASADDGEWGYELQATGEGGAPLEIGFDGASGKVTLPHRPTARVTVALTVSGTRAFAQALRSAFPAMD